MSAPQENCPAAGHADAPVTAWNPLDPALAVDPLPRYRALRETDPVYFEPQLGWWFVTGHEDARKVLREPDGESRFVAFQEVRMGRDVREEPYCRGIADFLPAVARENHRRIRGTFGRHFTPARVRTMREDVSADAHTLLDAVASGGTMELCAAFSTPLPLRTISRLLDVGEADQRRISQCITHFKLAIQFAPMDAEGLAKANASIGGLTSLFTEIVAARRAAPGTDLLSMMIAEADEGQLTEDELVANAWGLFAGGFETGAASIAGGLALLLEHPEQLRRLRADPTLMPAAVDELLRYAGPVAAQHRIFDHELQLGDHTIPPDVPIVCYLIGSNHDARWIEDPEQLDITRGAPRDHLAFGGGSHVCPGRHLAHMITEVGLETLLARLPGLRLDGEVEWDTENLPSVNAKRVPVAWDEAPAA
jgi:cytochrome P450